MSHTVKVGPDWSEIVNEYGRCVETVWGWKDKPGYIEERIEYWDWYETLPVGNRISKALTEIRTVGSRARTAKARVYSSDPEAMAIQVVLDHVVAMCAPFEKTGKTPKYPGGTNE